MNYFTSKTAEQLTLVSISHAREGKAGELKKACLDLIEKTRQEEGAISYHLYEDREDPCQFIFHEIWANEELWKKHTQSEHLQAFRARRDELTDRKPVLQRWERSEAPNPVIVPDSLVLFAYNRNKGNTEKEWQKILEDLIAPTLAEKGALHYELHVSKDDPKDFMFSRNLADCRRLERSHGSPHLISLVGILDRYTENGITVIKTKPID